MPLIEKSTAKYLTRRYGLRPLIWLANLVAYVVYKITPGNLWNLDRPIFIIGCPRSGTSIFEEMFRKHNDLLSWTEAGQIFQPDYYNAEKEHVMKSDDVNSFDTARIKIFFKLCTVLSGSKRFVNKNPRNSLRITYLKALYPDAVFVHVIRDGRAVTFSNNDLTLKTPSRRKLPFGGFCKPPNWKQYLNMESRLQQFAYQWIEIVNYIHETSQRHLTQKNYIEIKYEDLCDHVHETFTMLDNFCGLDPSRRRFEQIPEHLESKNMKWQTELSPEEIAEIESIIQEGLKRYQYLS